MAEQRDTITIRFKPEGDKSLINAIRTLDGATKKLVSTQVSLNAEGVKFIGQNNKLTKSTKKTSKGLFDLGHSARNGTAGMGGLG